ncbi:MULTISPECIES: dihydrofolate reductase family protein [unclassified Microbacterium]|uniref:dihydrofolate reductase family protein n=1 Tax=unclassified Microbacterium TaxID=2609290 RepID=UPI00214BA562|nr:MULTISPECIES: dihydrofolate reductase family protein [unclassified Microbacterium]MCR2808457.1 dihydrofolate reductase family protein [Microbacterium sp. zg.B185]WIM19100.1 dihydrofolate reductase family protein [Microbacterium sp. zg-B185]
MTDADGLGRIHIDLFTTLDGVGQAPGGPDEDRDGGFRFGGWQAPLFDELVGRQIMEGMADLDALLLGRRTYDIWADYWPYQDSGADASIARLFNSVPKYVASRHTPDLGWAGSALLRGDLATETRELRRRHRHIHVIGSIDLVQTLLAEQLFDELKLWVYPIVLGQGKKVFPDGAAPHNLRLLEPAVTSPTGTLLLRYGPAPGEPATGDMAGGA